MHGLVTWCKFCKYRYKWAHPATLAYYQTFTSGQNCKISKSLVFEVLVDICIPVVPGFPKPTIGFRPDTPVDCVSVAYAVHQAWPQEPAPCTRPLLERTLHSPLTKATVWPTTSTTLAATLEQIRLKAPNIFRMETTTTLNNGIKMPRLALGTWKVKKSTWKIMIFVILCTGSLINWTVNLYNWSKYHWDLI